MRILALILAACAATTLNWSEAGHSAPAAGVAEQRLPHISVTTMGKGDPVVLIPGLSTPRAVCNQIAPGLARSQQVILVQVNGFAGDDAGANIHAGILDGIVSDLHSYLAGRSLTKVRLTGHSMGGLTALKFARAHPESVDKVMIVDAPPILCGVDGPRRDPRNGQTDRRGHAQNDRVGLRQARRSATGGGQRPFACA
jgi:pimeloyl-ACP methyl ester carboxylesterase